MSDGRSMDEWLLRYLIVGLVGAVGTLALLYGLTLGESMAVTAGGAAGLAGVGGVRGGGPPRGRAARDRRRGAPPPPVLPPRLNARVRRRGNPPPRPRRCRRGGREPARPGSGPSPETSGGATPAQSGDGSRRGARRPRRVGRPRRLDHPPRWGTTGGRRSRPPHTRQAPVVRRGSRCFDLLPPLKGWDSHGTAPLGWEFQVRSLVA